MPICFDIFQVRPLPCITIFHLETGREGEKHLERIGSFPSSPAPLETHHHQTHFATSEPKPMDLSALSMGWEVPGVPQLWDKQGAPTPAPCCTAHLSLFK